MSPQPTTTVWRYIISHLRYCRLGISVMLLTAVVWAIDLSLRPYLLKIMINRLTAAEQSGALVALAAPIMGYMLMFALFCLAFRLYDIAVDIKTIPALRRRITEQAFVLLNNKSHAYHQDNFAGSLSNKVSDLQRNVPDFLQILIGRFFSHLLALLVAIITLWQVSGVFALITLLFALSFVGAALLASRYLTQYVDDWSETKSAINGRVVDVLGNVLSVRLFATFVHERAALRQQLNQAVRQEKKINWVYTGLWLVFDILILSAFAANFYMLSKGWQQGWVSVGDFALVIAINGAISGFLWQLGRDFWQFTDAYGHIKQALRAVYAAAEVKDHPQASDLQVTRGEIIFNDVTFAYTKNKALFNKKSVTIAAGQKVGLVGYSGGGKTTFAHLILRLYDATSGAIYIDGQDLCKVTQQSLREQIALIPQDPALFHRTLMENIRYGKVNASDEQVIAAAKKAHAHEFIVQLPNGYESLVGERGIKLSGGQRQRIAMARAVLKNAPIVLLDEATSQLDSLTERLIQDSLWQLMENKTALVIAHRLSTLLHMDRILVFDKGHIVQDGTHEQLVGELGLYQMLWNAQVGGFFPE